MTFPSEKLLTALGVAPAAGQPVFQWRDWDGAAWVVNAARSTALATYRAKTGRADATSLTGPTEAVVGLSIAHGAPTAPRIGDRFRLTISDAAADELGLSADDRIRFTGEVTDRVIDPVKGLQAVNGVGRIARQGRTRLNPFGWPETETDAARVARVLAALPGADVGTLDTGVVSLIKPVAIDSGAKFLEVAAVSGSGQVLERRTGKVDWHSRDHRRGATSGLTLDSCELLNEFLWETHVGDVVNDVEVVYSAGSVHLTDPSSVGIRGPYPRQVSTDLTSDSDAGSLANTILGRQSEPVDTLPAIVVDLVATVATAKAAAVLALEHGDRIALTGLPAGGPYTSTDVYVEGTEESATAAAWRLTLIVSDPALSGVAIRWVDVPAGKQWDNITATTRWIDLAAVEDATTL